MQFDFDHNNHWILDCSHQCNPLVFDCCNHSFDHNYSHHNCNHLNYTMTLKRQEIRKCRNLFFPLGTSCNLKLLKTCNKDLLIYTYIYVVGTRYIVVKSYKSFTFLEMIILHFKCIIWFCQSKATQPMLQVYLRRIGFCFKRGVAGYIFLLFRWKGNIVLY